MIPVGVAVGLYLAWVLELVGDWAVWVALAILIVGGAVRKVQ